MKFNFKKNVHLKPKLWQLALVCIFSFVTLQAQAQIITGTVSDNTGPLPGVSVVVKGTSIGAVSDFDGNYSINASNNATLVFSYVGYTTKEIKVNGQVVNVTLEEDISQLDEVVVVGYGTQKKKEVTGAVVTVKAEDLEKTTTSDIGAALQGQIAGVNITSSSGVPGEESNILIRGFSSLIDGQNGPLFVVDGIPFDNEIESIDVLKDAASASIYGTRGAGGVILITTKKGKVGQMSIRVNSEYGIQDITSEFDTMSPEQYNYIHLTRAVFDSDKIKGGVENDIQRNSTFFTNNTNIKDVLLNDNAPIQNHSVNVSGGKEGLTYNFNANYFGQEGVFFNSNLDRFNVRMNSQFTKGKWKFITGMTFRRDERLVPIGNIINRIFNFRVFKPSIDLNSDVLDNASEISTDDPNVDWQLNEARNLANTIRNLKTEDRRNSNNTTGNIQIEYDITKSLKVTARFGATYSNLKETRKIPRFDIFNTDGNLITNPLAVTSNRITSRDNSKLTSEQFLNYTKKFGKHNVKLLLGTSFEKSKQERFRLEVRNNINPAITVLDNYELLWDIESGGQDFTRTLQGNIGRIQYNYDGKYLFSASGRYDGSSQFSDGQKYGFFPSASVGWNISDEPFWEPFKPVINSFKFRASFGTTGNDRFATYSNQSVVEIGRDYVFGSNNPSPDINNPSADEIFLGTTQLEFANEDLKWETNIEQNFGFDFGLFKNRLTISTDVYKNEKRDLLYQVVNPPSTGVSGRFRNTIFNVGNMQNTGVEYAAKYRHKGKKSGFNWNVSATYTSNNNVVTQTSLNNPIINLDQSFISEAGSRELVSVITEGYEAASFFLRESNGIIRTQEQLDLYREIEPGAQLGELMYVDQLTEDTDGDGVADAGDGQINDADKVYAGSGTPDWEAGLNFSANYKNFDFSMQWYGSFGAEVMNGTKAYAYQVGTHRDLFYSWTEINTEANIPWFNGNNSTSFRGGSAFFLENGDFVRLRNIALGYSLPKKLLENIGMSKFRIYVQAQNPLTLTEYKGFDPEVGGNGLSTRGIDRGRYPLSSQYKVGLQLQF